MAQVRNGRQAHLVIQGVYDGPCGVQSANGISAAFYAPGHAAKRAERAKAALLDGERHRVIAAERSAITPGFVVLTLERAQ